MWEVVECPPLQYVNPGKCVNGIIETSVDKYSSAKASSASHIELYPENARFAVNCSNIDRSRIHEEDAGHLRGVVEAHVLCVTSGLRGVRPSSSDLPLARMSV